MEDRDIVRMTLLLNNQAFNETQIEDILIDSRVTDPTMEQITFLLNARFIVSLENFDEKIYNVNTNEEA